MHHQTVAEALAASKNAPVPDLETIQESHSPAKEECPKHNINFLRDVFDLLDVSSANEFNEL